MLIIWIQFPNCLCALLVEFSRDKGFKTAWSNNSIYLIYFKKPSTAVVWKCKFSHQPDWIWFRTNRENLISKRKTFSLFFVLFFFSYARDLRVRLRNDVYGEIHGWPFWGWKILRYFARVAKETSPYYWLRQDRQYLNVRLVV